MACHIEGMKRLTLREALRHVYWIGGGSAAGKSTIARRIAREYGWHVYSTDEVMADHARKSTLADCPLLHQFMSMEMDERWVNRTPERMLETFHWFQGEAFNLIIEDLLQLPRKPPIVAEGFRLLPRLVQPLLAQHSHAVWLLPTPKFRQEVFDKRGGPAWSFLAKTSDPKRALSNLLERDQRFTQLLRQETAELKLQAIEVDESFTEHDLTARVNEMFAL